MEYYKQSTEQVLAHFKSSSKGLSSDEAKRRTLRYGPNEITVKGTPLWRKIIEPFLDVFTAVLAIAVLISVWHKDYIDAIIIAVIIIASAAIYYAQRISAERVLRSLRSKSQATAEVIRDGKISSLPVAKLVAGDVIVVREGDKIPADARLLSASALQIDESHLTGESLPISKDSRTIKGDKPVYEQKNTIFQGSFVVGGQGQAVITSIGNRTEFGKLAELSAPPNEKSPVQQKIDTLITRVIFIILAISLIAFVLSLRQGMEMYESIRFVIALAVSAVPEGLPIAISVVLVLGMRRMALKNALARSLRAIETLGTITTIATDKTGTLTENRLKVQSIWSVASKESLLKAINLATNMTGEKTYDPVDQAIHNYAESQPNELSSAKPVNNFPFDQALAMSGCQYHHGDEFRSYIKGAPENIIEHSDLTESEREKAYIELNKYTAKGFRVIGFASCASKQQLQNLADISSAGQLRFDGLVSIADTLRKEAKSAIATATKAGITVRMITGDHYETAYHIGKELGLVTQKNQVFDSSSISELSDNELQEVIVNARVFSRVIPKDKHRLLSALKKRDITAMTGDGVNDVPALTNAHVGIAMGSGTSIAKDAGDIILIDDNFRTIVSAIREGRTIFSNVKRMVAYLLATNGGEVILNIGALALGTPIPLVPVQLLWVNLVTDTSMAIPLGLEPGDKNVMKRPPVAANAPLLSRLMITRLIIIATIVGFLSLSVYLFFLDTHGVAYARTIAFSAIVVIQWGNALAMRSDTEYSWRILLKPNRAFWVGLGVSILLHAVALFTPIAEYLHVGRVEVIDLVVVSLASFLVPLIAVDLHKLWCNRRPSDNLS